MIRITKDNTITIKLSKSEWDELRLKGRTLTDVSIPGIKDKIDIEIIL